MLGLLAPEAYQHGELRQKGIRMHGGPPITFPRGRPSFFRSAAAFMYSGASCLQWSHLLHDSNKRLIYIFCANILGALGGAPALHARICLVCRSGGILYAERNIAVDDYQPPRCTYCIPETSIVVSCRLYCIPHNVLAMYCRIP